MLIGSGASVSKFPPDYANQLGPSFKKVTATTDYEVCLYGTYSMALDLDLGQTISYKFLVTNLLQ